MTPPQSAGDEPSATRDVATDAVVTSQGNDADITAFQEKGVRPPRAVRVPATPVKILFVAANAEARHQRVDVDAEVLQRQQQDQRPQQHAANEHQRAEARGGRGGRVDLVAGARAIRPPLQQLRHWD